MNRGQFIAILIGVVAAIGLFATWGNRSAETSDAAVATDSAPTGSSAASETSEPTTTEPPPVLVEAPENLGPAGSLSDLDGWLQTEATSYEDFDGRVKIVQFWTFGCFNCKNTIPHLQDIYATYQPKGLEIIGVHAPEFDYEKDPAAVAEAAIDHGVIWPIALDTRKTNFRTWQTERRFWPRTFVLDVNGDIRFDHIGEGAYDELEATVAFLIDNGGA